MKLVVVTSWSTTSLQRLDHQGCAFAADPPEGGGDLRMLTPPACCVIPLGFVRMTQFYVGLYDWSTLVWIAWNLWPLLDSCGFVVIVSS